MPSDGWDLTLGPAGGIVDGSYTCEYCGQELDTVSFVQAALHRLDCDARPHPDQATLTDGGMPPEVTSSEDSSQNDSTTEMSTPTDAETGEPLEHYEWNGWLWCEPEQEAFDWETGEVECPHCGDVFEVSKPTLHVNADGLWIPPELRESDSQIVIRTPRVTLQHFGSQPLDPYYGMVDESHFGELAEMASPKNPGLAPDRVSIKPQGEDAVEYDVDLEPDLIPDGGESPPGYPTEHLQGLLQMADLRYEERIEAHGPGKNWLDDEARWHIWKACDELFQARDAVHRGSVQSARLNFADALNYMLFAMEIADQADRGESA